MDLIHAIHGRPKWGSSEIVPDAAADHPHLEGQLAVFEMTHVSNWTHLYRCRVVFWNWCVLEGCRPIIKAGRLYEKRGVYKQYK